MSDPLATIFHGDLNIETGFDTTEFGFGDLTVNRGITMNPSFTATSSVVSLNATASSNVTTNAGTLTLQSSDTGGTGIIHLTSSGTAVNAVDIDTATGGFSIDSVLSSNMNITSGVASTLSLGTTGHTGNKISLNTVTSTASDAITLDSDLGGVRINSDGIAGGSNGVVITAIDDSSFTTTDGSLTLETNSSTVTDKLELVNTQGTNVGSSGAGAVDINAVAGGVSIDAVLSSRVLITSSAAAELLLQTTGDVANKITLNTVTSTASDAITLDSDLGGVRINSDGVAGGSNGVVITAIDDSSFTTTDGSLTLEANSSTVTDKLELSNTQGTNAGSSGAGAVDINAVAGGVSIDAVLSSRVLITSSVAAELLLQTTGNVANKITLNTVTSTASDSIKLDSDLGGVRINSDGIAGGSNGIVITSIDDSSFTTTDGSLTVHANSSTVTDDLVLKNTGGTNVSAVDISAVAGGFSIDSVLNSNITVTSGVAANLSIGTSGNAGNTLSLTTATSTETNAINIDSTSGGIRLDAGIGIVMTAVNDSSITTSAGALTLNVNSSDVSDIMTLKNTLGTEVDAVHIEASAGGILIDANGGSGNSLISIQTDDTTNGVSIATVTAGIPVFIGTATSTTTIPGNLIVSGTKTTLNTETLTVEDNIILVNSGPSGTADGGTAVKRFQGWNDGASGDVVGGTSPDELSSSHASDGFLSSATSTTVVFKNDGATAPSSVDDYYNGWWIIITGGTGDDQVRRIADYVGSSRTATIFTTSDETSFPQVPATGRNWTVTPSTDSTYSLYSCSFILSMYDESNNEWIHGCTALDPATAGQPVITNYVNLHVKDLTVEGDLVVNGSINNITLDSMEIVTLVDNTTTGIVVTGTETYGSYQLYVKEVESNSLSAATVTTGSFALFMCSGRSGKAGNAQRITQAAGADSEKIDVEWNQGEKIKIKYRPAPSGGSGGNRYYSVRVSKNN
jgi:peptidyl-tRNA hydrolase